MAGAAQLTPISALEALTSCILNEVPGFYIKKSCNGAWGAWSRLQRWLEHYFWKICADSKGVGVKVRTVTHFFSLKAETGRLNAESDL